MNTFLPKIAKQILFGKQKPLGILQGRKNICEDTNSFLIRTVPSAPEFHRFGAKNAFIGFTIGVELHHAPKNSVFVFRHCDYTTRKMRCQEFFATNTFLL